MSTPHPIPWLFIVLPALAVQWTLLWLLIRRLRLHHLIVWTELGEPRVFAGTWQRMIAQYRLLFFVFRTQYVDLLDDQVAFLIWCARFGFVLLAIIALLSLIKPNFS
jgi:hypothetical protein